MKMKTEILRCNKPDRDVAGMKCGYPLPCPWHTVVIEQGAPLVNIPLDLKTTQLQRKNIRKLAVELNDALEE